MAFPDEIVVGFENIARLDMASRERRLTQSSLTRRNRHPRFPWVETHG